MESEGLWAKKLTLAFGLGQDLIVSEIKSHFQLHAQQGDCLRFSPFFSLCPSPACSCSFKIKKINKQKAQSSLTTMWQPQQYRALYFPTKHSTLVANKLLSRTPVHFCFHMLSSVLNCVCFQIYLFELCLLLKLNTSSNTVLQHPITYVYKKSYSLYGCLVECF